jgi:hypothetical protein
VNVSRYIAALALAGCVGDMGSGVSPPVGDGGSAPSTGGGGIGGEGGSGEGGTAGAGGTYVPDPIPELDDEPPALCDSPAPGGFQFMNDTCEAKRFPGDVDRERPCALLDASAEIALAGGGTVTYQPSSEAPLVDGEALVDLVPAELDVTVILIRRVGGVPHYRFLSNGSHDVSFQPWSTSKFLAAANAGARLRLASGGEVGLTASVGGTALGDLVTSLHNYDNAPYSSNAIGAYFHDIGTRQRARDLIGDLWLGRPASESFGGNYGQAAAPLGYDFSDGAATLDLDPDTSSGFVNHLSTFTLADALRRLALHREEPALAMPGLEWADARTLLYGAEGSAYGPFGGMSADRAVYLQSAHDLDYLEARSRGTWRIFSKLGTGSDGQFLDVGYACLPVLDDAMQPVEGWGRELVIAAHLPTGGASWAERDRILARAFRTIVIRAVDGRL